MTEVTTGDIFLRTLPLFDNRDRDTIQRLLHHAVEDLRYDHPDRKIARDLYHEIHEGDAIRLQIGPGLDNETLVITPEEVDSDINDILERFVGDMRSKSGEWSIIASELNDWQTHIDSNSNIKVAFEYLH